MTADSAIPARASAPPQPRPQAKILFQKFFKSVGPRTYAAQVKEASTGNHFIVLTEGKRDSKTNELRKTRLFVFSEDFAEFFELLSQVSGFVKSHPVPGPVRRRQQAYWSQQRKPTQACAAGIERPTS